MILGTIVANNALLPLGFVQSLLQVKQYDHVMQAGPSIPDNRNAVFERARVERQPLLFIDSDMVFTPSDVEQIKTDLETMDIVTGIYAMAFPSWPASIFDNDMKLMEPQKELFEVGACGAGFLGISLKVLDLLNEPFSPRIAENGRRYGEDVSFCLNARDAGFKVWCDPVLRLGHIKPVTKYYGRN